MGGADPSYGVNNPFLDQGDAAGQQPQQYYDASGQLTQGDPSQQYYGAGYSQAQSGYSSAGYGKINVKHFMTFSKDKFTYTLSKYHKSIKT